MARSKEANTVYMREYRRKHRAKMRLYYRRYNKQWRKEHGYHNEDKWKANNPTKVQAQGKARWGLRIGKITKQPCEVCGTRRWLVMHHDDYSKPLEVRFLCKKHHREIHYGSSSSPQKAMVKVA